MTSLNFQKELDLSETTEDTLEGWEKAVVKCSDSGMQQTRVQTLVPCLVRFHRFLNLSELQFPYLQKVEIKLLYDRELHI